MKTLRPLLLCLLFFACTTSTTTESTQDSSTVAADTRDVQSVADTEEEMPDEAPEVMSGDLDGEYEKLKGEIDNLADGFHRVSVSFSGYEASSEETWLFNSALELRFFSNNWSVEGHEGSGEYIIRGDEVICAEVIENSTVEKWCEATAGTSTATDDESGEKTVTPLISSYGSSCTQSVMLKLQQFSAFLKEAEITSEDGDMLTLREEKVVNYGQDFTESTEVQLPRVVYEKLK